MTRILGWARTGWILLALFVMLLTSAVALITSPSPKVAAAGECKLLVVIDRSGSVNDSWTAFVEQIMSLIDLGELEAQIPGLEIGYWTFSDAENGEPPVVNGVPVEGGFNGPYHDYMPLNTASGTTYDNFRNTLENVLPGGLTNYEQGFGYHGGQRNNNATIQRMQDDADAIAFLTDGAPNFPGNGLDATTGLNPEAIQKGKQARDTYRDAAGNKLPVIAGFINPDDDDAATDVLRQVVNEPGDPDSNIGPITGFDDSIYTFLLPRIIDACGTPPANTYQLIPQVGIDGSRSMVTNGDEVTFTNSVEREGDGSGVSGWQVVNVVLKPRSDTTRDMLTFPRSSAPCTTPGISYCDNRPDPSGICSFVLSTISNNGDCSLGASGSQTFSQALTSLPNNSVVIGDLEPGTRVCSMLLLTRPVSTGTRNRLSSIQCILIGKVPTVEVWGGDMRVGKRFVGDSSVLPTSGIYTRSYALKGSAYPAGRQYGSWVEYSVLAPGRIESIASLSGYSHGFDRSLLAGNLACQPQTNILTFANTIDAATPATDCGDYPSGSGFVPDVVNALTVFPQVPVSTPSLRFDNASADAGDKPVLYRTNSDITIEASTITAGKSFVVYAPTSTVTITGPIVYEDVQPYTNLLQIPQLVIIARNINILDGVGRVDAWLIAPGQADGQGIINTCVVDANGVRRTPATLSTAVCGGKLEINGPIMARELQVWRTRVFSGTCELNNLSDKDDMFHCSNFGSAERINLPGSSLLWAQALGVNPSRVQTTHTTELPPYF